jgi:uncharacterized protein
MPALSFEPLRARKLPHMSKRLRDPLRLDVAAAAADGAELSGQWPLAALGRLAEDALGQGDQAVEWRARFEQRAVSRGAPRVRLHLLAHTHVWRDCQRCLQPVALDLRVDNALRFVATEDEAAALDADSDEDLLVLSRQFDLRALVEDELLLALPLVPMHDVCPLPPEPPAATGGAPDVAPAHPFAALAALKRGGGR